MGKAVMNVEPVSQKKSQPSTQQDDRLLRVAKVTLAALAAICGGGVLVLSIAQVWCQSLSETIGPLATMFVGSASVFGALSAVERWESRKLYESEMAIRRHREEIYSDLIFTSANVFLGEPPDLKHLLRVRSEISAWASRDVVRSLVAWTRAVRPFATGETVSLTNDQSEALRSKLDALVHAIRSDLGHTEDSTLDGFRFVDALIEEAAPAHGAK